jgi:DNA-binding transcriptional MerR regulator
MDLVGIGEFARLSGLSQKALRRYDELGLLPPARVDASSGYRRYAPGQVERARLVALLRQIGVPLARIQAILDLDAEAAAERVGAYWTEVEAAHTARRDLAGHLIDRLNGKGSTMYEVDVRDVPARSLLSLHCHVHADRLTALGKGFLARLRSEAVPRPPGVAGAPFIVYHGLVDDDGDGPIEWNWPVPEEQALELAARFPDLTLRAEAAHQEAFTRLASAHADGARTAMLAEVLTAWAGRNGRRPTGAVRQVLTPDAPPPGVHPGCDWALPLR